MPHADLVATLTIALAAALVGGALAKRIGLSPIVGYLLAGIAVARAPGGGADPAIAQQLAEIGIVLLMFGVGLHFSPRELAEVRAVAVPGALVQAGAATGFGLALGLAWGWRASAGLVLGLALAVASTVVLMRGLLEQKAERSPAGRLAIAWLIVEDLLTVAVLVLLPWLAPSRTGSLLEPGTILTLALSLVKIAAIVVFVLVAGRRIVPWILDHVARLRSRELFTLAVLAIALGVAWGASRLTGVSMALGAFLAGMVVGQSDLSLQAAAEALPLRDAFAVLFFVSVGMLFDPTLIVSAPGHLLAALGLVLIAKPAVALVLVLAMGHPLRAALTVAAGLAQIGEFSFIVAGLARELGLLPAGGHGVILAVALVSIAINPLLFRLVGPVDHWVRGSPLLARLFVRPDAEGVRAAGLADHVVLCGYGRIGAMLRELLSHRGHQFVVIEQDRRAADVLRRDGVAVVVGDAANPLVLEHAGVERARTLVVAFGDPIAARLAVDHALDVNPSLRVLARAGSPDEEARFAVRGSQVGAVFGEREAALELARLWLLDEGVGALESEALLMDLRRAQSLARRPEGTRLVEAKVPAGSAAAGRRVRALGLPDSLRVVLIERDGGLEVPHGATEIREGDRLVVLADHAGLAILQDVLAPGR